MLRAHGKYVEEALDAVRCPARVVIRRHNVDERDAPSAAAHRDDSIVERGRYDALRIGANTADR